MNSRIRSEAALELEARGKLRRAFRAKLARAIAELDTKQASWREVNAGLRLLAQQAASDLVLAERLREKRPRS